MNRMLVALSLILVPLALSAQEPPPQQVPPGVQSWMTEMQQIQAQLAPIEQQALQDPALQEEREAVETTVRAAMIEADPTVAERLDRMEELLVEARAAQEAGDQDRIIQLTAEAQEIQPQVARAQNEALNQPEVAARIEAFQAQLRAKMIEIEPEAEPLLQRLRELERQITAAVQPPQNP